MAQYFTDFSEYTAGAQPSDWTERFVTGDITWQVENSVISGVTGGKVLEMVRTGANARSMLSWDDIDSDANRATVEILFKSRRSALPFGVRAMGRASGTVTNEDAWYGGHNGTTVSAGGYIAGTFSSGTTNTSFTPAGATWIWTRFQLDGNNRRVRMWNDGDTEPGTWNIDDADGGSITGAGWVGLFSFSQSNTGHIIDVFGVGTNGDSAPSSDSSETITAVVGALTLTGNDATTTYSEAAETLVAETASLSLTGNSVILDAIRTYDAFECGQCDTSKTVVTNGDTLTPTIELYGRPGVNVEGATPANAYYSITVQVDGVNGKTPVFDINLDEPGEVIHVYGGGGYASEWRCWATYDDPIQPNATYFRLANSAVVGNYQRVSHSSAFTQNRVYIITRPVYSYTMVRAHLDSISGNAHVTMPPSSTGNDFVYFDTTATTSDGGRVVPSLGMLSYKITDAGASPDDGSAKRVAVLLGRQHADEEQANYILEGSVDYLLSGAADANNLLKNWEFYVYPMVNCSGVHGGAYRGTCQSGQRDQDLNRDWPGGTTDNRLEEQTNTRAAILTDTGDNIDAVLDYHGRLTIDNTLFYVNNRINGNFYANLNSVYTTVDNQISGIAGSATTYYRTTIGVPLSVIPEGDGILANGTQDLTEFTVFGEALMQALDDSFNANDFQEMVTGALTLTGHDAATIYSTPDTVMTAEVGVLSLTGNVAATTRAITIPAEVGSVVLTGNDATFVRTTSNTLEAQVGTLTLTGHDATLIDSATAVRLTQLGTDMRRNLRVTRGQTFKLKGVARDQETGERINITNDVMVWRLGSDDLRQVLLTVTESDGIVKTDATRGEWEMTVSGDKTANITPARYRHQGEMTFSDMPSGFVSGRFELRRDLG